MTLPIVPITRTAPKVANSIATITFAIAPHGDTPAMLQRDLGRVAIRTFRSGRTDVNLPAMSDPNTRSTRSGPASRGGDGALVGVCLQPDQLASLDAWIGQKVGREPYPSRPEAIRSILREYLK